MEPLTVSEEIDVQIEIQEVSPAYGNRMYINKARDVFLRQRIDLIFKIESVNYIYLHGGNYRQGKSASLLRGCGNIYIYIQ